MYRIWLVLLLGSLHAMAETRAVQQGVPKPNYSFRVLAIGASPPLIIEHQDGQRIQRPPAEGSIPPLTLYAKSAGEPLKFSPRLGRVSRVCRLKLNEERGLRLYTSVPQENENADSTVTSWWKGQLPLGRKALVLLFREHKAKNWDKPLGLCLRDDAVHFPANAIRLVNVSSLPIVVKIDQEKPSVLKPGKHVIYQRPKAEFEFGLYVKNNKGKYVRLYRKFVHNRKNNRTNVILYKKKPRSQGKPPVGVQIVTDKRVS